MAVNIFVKNDHTPGTLAPVISDVALTIYLMDYKDADFFEKELATVAEIQR